VDAPTGQFDTVITGTVAADQARAQPAVAGLCIGTAKLTTPLVADVALLCPSVNAGVVQAQAIRKRSFLDMVALPVSPLLLVSLYWSACSPGSLAERQTTLRLAIALRLVGVSRAWC
jgi:hypothetical protein